jgi:copper resistance protein B
MTRGLLGLGLALLATAAAAQRVDPYPMPPKEWPHPVMDHELFSFALLDRFEYLAKSGHDAWAWNAQGWFGGDRYRLWLKTEGEGQVRGPAERGDVQALLARRISPYWHLQAGIREDARPKPSRTTGVLALQGLAPYWFNVEASAFFGNDKVSGRLETEYDQLLTQRLIVQPRFESNWSGSSDRERGLGSGINDLELGLRLRYEVRREFAPYIGVNWTRRLGDTADLARAAGRDTRETALVLGVRAWY